MWGAIASAAASVIGSLMNKGGDGAPQQTDLGLQSSMAGTTPPPAANVESSGTQASSLVTDAIKDFMSGASQSAGNALAGRVGDLISGGARRQGKDARQYLAAAFPELNPWERAGAGGSMAGAQMGGMDKDVQIAKMNNEAQIKIAGIQSATARMNTYDQVFAQNALLDSERNLKRAQAYQADQAGTLASHQMPVADAQVAKLKADTKLSHSQARNVDQDTSNKEGASSVVGGIYKDVKHAIKTDVAGLIQSVSESATRPDGWGSKLKAYGDKVKAEKRELIEKAAEANKQKQELFEKSGGIRGPMGRKTPTVKFPSQ